MLRILNLRPLLATISWKGIVAATIYLVVVFILWGEGGILIAPPDIKSQTLSLLSRFVQALKELDLGTLIFYLLLSTLTAIFLAVAKRLVSLKIIRVFWGLLGWLTGSIFITIFWLIVGMAPITTYSFLIVIVGGYGFLIGYFGLKGPITKE
jgi:hypothetical protein